MWRFSAFLICFSFSLTVYSKPHEDTAAIVWMQQSAEYHANMLQNYKLASLSLDNALKQKRWTAALEQFDNKAVHKLPPAIILALDDTITSTMPYYAQLNLNKKESKNRYWQDWIDYQKAPLLPGVIHFIQQAAKKGIKVMVISNRLCVATRQDKCPIKTQTKAMLKRNGLAFDKDDLLFRGEFPDWNTDKSTRRAFIAKSYRILLIVGDDISDMIPNTFNTPSASRHLYVKQYEKMWGERWFLLPNPVNGSWRNIAGQKLQSNLKGWK